jgi:hypothetical protein
MHWEVAGIGKYHLLLVTCCCVLLPLSRGADFSWLCFGTPDFPTANSQMRMRYSIGGFRKMQQVGLWLWKLKNVALLAVRHQ